jgi:arsenical pump membrane protein
VLWLTFRRQIPVRYALAKIENPDHAIHDRLLFRAAFPVLGLLFIAYFVVAPLGVPVSAVTAGGALILLFLAGRWHQGGRGARISVAKVLRGAPWQIVIFSLGMYLVVYGLRNAGLTGHLADALVWLSTQSPWVAALGTGFGAAILSSVMNNMPSVLIGTLAIEQAHAVPALTRELMIYANIIGCDLGPKFTPIGSLATLLWLNVLSRKGISISWGQYMKVGLLITPPVLLGVLIALAVWLQFLGAA